MLRDGSEASRALEGHGVDLPAAREALGGLVDRGVVPGPPERRRAAGLSASTWRRSAAPPSSPLATGAGVGDPGGDPARRHGVGRVARTPLRDPPMLISQVLVHAGQQARALGIGVIGGAVAAGGGHRHPDALAPVHEQPVAAAAVCLGRAAQGLPGRRWAAAGGGRRRPGPARWGPAGGAWGGRTLRAVSGRGEEPSGGFRVGRRRALRPLHRPGPAGPGPGPGGGRAGRPPLPRSRAYPARGAAEGQSEAARVLRARRVDLAAARAALARLAGQGVVPAPRPSDASCSGCSASTWGRSSRDRAGLRLPGGRGGNLAGDPPAPVAGRTAVWTPLCARRSSPSGPCSWPASRRKPSATARSQPNICCSGCWRMRQPADKVRVSRRHRRIIAHVGLPDGYRGAAGRLLEALGVDLDQLHSHRRVRRGPGMSRRGRLGFVAACLLAFGLIAALITWGPPSTGPSTKTPASVTLAPGRPDRPAWPSPTCATAPSCRRGSTPTRERRGWCWPWPP